MVLWRIKNWRWVVTAAVLLCLLSVMGMTAQAEESAHSHASVMEACPECSTPWTPIVYEPTCESAGFTSYICRECGNVELVGHADKLPHSWKQIASKAPTCTEKGSITRRCTECRTTEDVPDGEALGHNYQTEVVEPTCSSLGYTLHTCVRCTDSYQTDQTQTSDHTYSQVVVTEPTCHSTGRLRNICEICGDATAEEIPSVDHAWHTETVSATHTAQGYTVYTCQFDGCGTVKRENFIDPLPYDMVWTEQAATCTAGGLKVGYCADGCGHTETVVLSPLGHSFGEWITVREADESGDGLESHVCERCQHMENQTVPYDPAIHIKPAEPIKPLTLVIIGFFLIVGLGVVALLFLLLLEHARRDKSKRLRRVQ